MKPIFSCHYHYVKVFLWKENILYGKFYTYTMNCTIQQTHNNISIHYRLCIPNIWFRLTNHKRVHLLCGWKLFWFRFVHHKKSMHNNEGLHCHESIKAKLKTISCLWTLISVENRCFSSNVSRTFWKEYIFYYTGKLWVTFKHQIMVTLFNFFYFFWLRSKGQNYNNQNFPLSLSLSLSLSLCFIMNIIIVDV